MIREALQQVIPRLQAAGVETPRLDAELLLAHALGRDRTYLIAHAFDPLPPDAAATYEALLTRRAGREPLPYILGDWEWMGMRFRVTPAVLIPRPETETLVEETARRLTRDARILDVGAGTGCIAVGLAKLLPQALVTTLEVSPEAAAVARENIVALGVGERVTVVEGRFPQASTALGTFDAVVSNPPYIPSRGVNELEPELRIHEPRLALDGGADGLDVLRALAEHGTSLLRPGGLLAVELAMGQAPTVVRILGAIGWVEIETLHDLGDVERFVMARRARGV